MISAFLRCLFSILFIFTTSNLFSQDQKDEVRKDIFADEYKINLINNEADFFTGCINITDKNNNIVFNADSIYSRYNWDTLVDLNNDGSRELILDLGTGATMYDYNIFLIFDFSDSLLSPLVVHNAELKTDIDITPKILSHIRLSPSVMGAGYSFSLKYESRRLILENDIKESAVLKSLDTDSKEDLHLIKEYSEAFDECAEDSEVKIYYEAYIMQQKILGQEEKGWEFFNKHYKCKNKNKVKAELKENVDQSYSFLKQTEFKFY